MLYAVTVAGVPGRILGPVLDALRQRYSDTFVIMGRGAPLSDKSLTTYDTAVVDASLEASTEAVFGKTKRPHGFCRNSQRPCALRNAHKDDCGKTPEHTCSLQRPDFLVLVYQEGLQEDLLLRRFHYAPLSVRLPKECYNRRDRTIEAISERLSAAKGWLGQIRSAVSSTKSPLLLPPLNFDVKSLTKLLSGAAEENLKASSEAFKRAHFSRDTKAYDGSRGLQFKPADSGGKHGAADTYAKPEIALTRQFRLGCQYSDDFHYDVTLSGEQRSLKGLKFVDRATGDYETKDDRLNILVDDCIR